jgi:hypothetical protein
MPYSVYVVKKRRRRGRRTRTFRPAILFGFLGLFFLLAIFEESTQGPVATRIIRTVPESHSFAEYAVPVEKESLAEKRVYPYSVIRGGVRDRSELVDAILDDPVVAEHYADFNTAEARIVRVQDARLVHVSYRIDNKIFWTARKIQLAQGEALVSDGQQLARARCGNRISVEPQQPTAAEEPAPEVFITPVIPVDLPDVMETITSEPLYLGEEINTSFPSVVVPELLTLEDQFFYEEFLPYTPIERFTPYYFIEPPPDFSEVPEPATWILLASGCAAYFALRRLRGKKSLRQSADGESSAESRQG